MRQLSLALALLFVFATSGQAANISGEYLEARTCSVYTGPCFANAEMGLAGKDALMAWKIDKGHWKGVTLDGLGAAVIVSITSVLTALAATREPAVVVAGARE